MENWLFDPTTEFYLWGQAHLWTIIISATLLVMLYIGRHRFQSKRKIIRLTVGILLLISRITLDIWYVTTGQWSVTHALPLELCSIASLVCSIMLLTNSRFLFEIFYFIALGGAIQAIVTPELGFGFPQYRYIQFFLDHTLLIAAPLILIWYYHYTITWKSLIYSFVALNLMAALVFGLNLLFNSNYMFLMHKPDTASLIDYLGPHPYYLLALEGIVLTVFTLLYLPFLFRKIKKP